MNQKRNKTLLRIREFFRLLFRKKITVLALAIFLVLVVMVLLAPVIAPYGYDDQDISRAFTSPCREFLFGTDKLGRDIFSRVLYGGRISLSIGIIATLIASAVGILLGAVSGYYGGWFDNVLMHLFDVLMSMPPILLAIAISASLGNGIMNAALAVIVTAIPMKARLARGQVLTIRSQEYMEAAIATNASTAQIIFRHVLPNILPVIIVQITLTVAGSITTVASLSYLGLGVQAPFPEWGAMLSAGRSYLKDYPYVILAPGIALLLTLFSLNVLGDGIRDALDPRLKD